MWPALIRLPKRNGGVSTLHVITLFQWHLVVLFERNGGVSSPHVNPLSMIPRGPIWALANVTISVLGTMRHQTFGWFGNGLKVFSPWPCSHEKSTSSSPSTAWSPGSIPQSTQRSNANAEANLAVPLDPEKSHFSFGSFSRTIYTPSKKTRSSGGPILYARTPNLVTSTFRRSRHCFKIAGTLSLVSGNKVESCLECDLLWQSKWFEQGPTQNCAVVPPFQTSTLVNTGSAQIQWLTHCLTSKF